MADLSQRSKDLTAALEAYDALLCLAVEQRRIGMDVQDKFDRLEPEDKRAFHGLIKIMARNMGLEI